MKVAAEKQDYRSEFFENSDMLISIYDKNLNLVDANPAFLKGLHLELDKITGTNISEISPDCKSSGRYKIYEEVIRTGKGITIDQLRLHPALGGLYLRLNAFRIGEGLGIASRDITDLMETIGDLETFVSKASHDVRSPISTILGLINVARNELGPDDAAVKYLDLIRQQAHHLDEIVMRLIETSSIRQGEQKLQAVNFEEKIRRVLDSMSDIPAFSKVEFQTHVTVPVDFYSDSLLLTTILHHLFLNSIKYRDERKNICKVQVHVNAEKNGVMIKVSDNGIGIPEHLQKDVFKMFFRATNVATGSGLGLYTVRHCVKKLQGHINMESRAGQGTTFRIYIPNAGAAEGTS